MIKIENVEIVGWEAAIRGMRNPMNSWDKSDTRYCTGDDSIICESCKYNNPYYGCENELDDGLIIGDNDLDLMNRLSNAGAAHAKYKRMINVYCDIVAPMYWWKEWDTYLHTVRNSCSTMHKIQAKEFTMDDFSCEYIGHVPNCDPQYMDMLTYTISVLNEARHCFLDTKDKQYWWQMIQLLPSSYNQLSTVMMNYETLTAMYRWRRTHKLDEWQAFCDWIESLPYSELITGKKEQND